MKRILLIFIFFPGFLFSQENKNKTSEKPKVDGWSGSTYMNNEKKLKAIFQVVKSLEDKKSLEFQAQLPS